MDIDQIEILFSKLSHLTGRNHQNRCIFDGLMESPKQMHKLPHYARCLGLMESPKQMHL
jgi:hypothetical protein